MPQPAQLRPADNDICESYRHPTPASLPDDQRRLLEYYQPIDSFTRCEYKLDCIDCHTKLEIMGDGVLHNNKATAVYIRCATCHGTRDTPPQSVSVSEALSSGTPTATINPAASAVLVTQRGEIMPNIQFVNGQWIQASKVTGQSYRVPLVQGSTYQQKSDEQASSACHQCHSVDRDRAQGSLLRPK